MTGDTFGHRAGTALSTRVRAACLVILPWILLGCASASGRGERFEQIQVASLPAVDAKTLGVLTSGRGSLLIFGSNSDSLTVRYAVSTQSRAGLFRNQVETIDKGDSLLVAIRPTAGSAIDLQVEAPEQVAVQLVDDEGRQVVVRNLENRVDVIRHRDGSLDLDDIDGPLVIQDGAGSIRVHDVRGPIVIRDDGGDVVIEGVTNSVVMESRQGDVRIEGVGQDVRLELGRGELVVRDVAGKLSYRKTGPGRVTIERVVGGVEKL
jgi:hypothetical protein